MISAYLVLSEGAGAPDVAADLGQAGLKVLGQGEARTMVAEVLRTAPDILVCYEDHPDDAFFAGIEALNQSAPRPTVVFTADRDAGRIDRAIRAGVHAYEVAGYGPARLRPVVHAAQARFRHIEALRAELSDVQSRFSERKLVDQAKALLMRLRNLPEDEAYAALRSAAMKANRRMGQLARQVIEAARYAEAVNRAGQLRMISQRLVKLCAVLAAAPGDREAAVLLADGRARADATLSALERSLSEATFGDLLAGLNTSWAGLRAALEAAPSPANLPILDEAADLLLQQAEQLTAGLEAAGSPAPLRLINVAGRQRMLSQRFAKQALLGAARPGPVGRAVPEALAATGREYRAAMVYLQAVPLSTPAISALFSEAGRAWAALEDAARRADTTEGRAGVLASSEALLATYDALTDHYERHLQDLMQA